MVGWWPFELLTYRPQEPEPGAKEGKGGPDCPLGHLGGFWFHPGCWGLAAKKG